MIMIMLPPRRTIQTLTERGQGDPDFWQMCTWRAAAGQRVSAGTVRLGDRAAAAQ